MNQYQFNLLQKKLVTIDEALKLSILTVSQRRHLLREKKSLQMQIDLAIAANYGVIL